MRKVYLKKGPCQPNNHIFKKQKIGNSLHRFNHTWFSDYKVGLKKKRAFLLCCHVSKIDAGRQGGGDGFVKEGFDALNKNDRFDKHVGDLNNTHNRTWIKCEYLIRKDQHIDMTHN